MTPLTWHDYRLVRLPRVVADLIAGPADDDDGYRLVRPEAASAMATELWMRCWRDAETREPAYWSSEMQDRLLVARHWLWLRWLVERGKVGV